MTVGAKFIRNKIENYIQIGIKAEKLNAEQLNYVNLFMKKQKERVKRRFKKKE